MRAASTSTIPTRCRSVAAHPGGQHLASQEKKEVTRMRRASDEGVHHEPGHLAQAGPQDTGDAGHGTRTRLPGTCDQPGPGCSAASEPVTDVLALRPWPGTQARLVVTACGDGPGTVFEGLPAGGWALAGGDVVLDIAWRDGPGSHPGTDVAIRQMAGGDLVVVAAWEGLRSSWPERARPAVAAVMNLYSALELAGGEIYLQPPGQWPQPAATQPARPQPQTTTARSPAITSGVLAPLLEAGVLQPGETLTWRRRNKGATYTATVLPGGALQTADGRVHATVCAAAVHVSGIYGSNGWQAWRRADGVSLGSLRQPLLTRYPHLYSPRTPSPDPAHCPTATPRIRPVTMNDRPPPRPPRAHAAACRPGSGHRHSGEQ